MAQTPKEKALYLINKMLRASPNVQDGVNKIDFIQAKICAEFAVDEILNNFGNLTDGKQHYSAYATIQYYKEVQKEINKL